MDKKYRIIEIKQNGTKRLLMRAVTDKQAFRIKLDLMKRFAESLITIEREN